MYQVRTVSTQIQSNHLAWSRLESEHTTLEAAEIAAQELWQNMCESVAGTDFEVGDSVFVHEC